MYKFNRFYLSKIILMVSIFSLVSCFENDGLTFLPSKYSIKKERSLFTALDEINIYSFSNDISIDELKSFPKFEGNNTPLKKRILKWRKLSETKNDFERKILNLIKESIESSDKKDIELNELLNVKNDLYFSGYFKELKGLSNETNNFYLKMFFLNLKTKKIYEFRYID